MEIKEYYNSIIPRYPELKRQVAVVTGGAKGIGQGIALRLGREGMRLVIADIDKESLASTTALLTELGVEVLAFAGDLSQTAVIDQLFTVIPETFNRIDLLVNNAADLNRRRLLDEHKALLEQQLATNVSGPYLCSFQAAKIMRKTGSGGNIIHISSVGAIRAHWKGLPYDVTKGAINAMTRAMAIDLAEYNIRVNAIGPGAIKTYRTGSSGNTAVQEMSNRIPLKRFGLVSEISSVTAFLASQEASYITGQVIYVDGGITAQLSPPKQWL
ncbi:MAG: SDR family oxidoreductase [Anaerolineales bacterium]|nr:SDR family oxidoreductase [Anaerolineales bacterium]